jgi:hypothetical protein
MQRIKLVSTALAVLMLLSATTAEAANDLGRARGATAHFHDVANAQAAGYGGPL